MNESRFLKKRRERKKRTERIVKLVTMWKMSYSPSNKISLSKMVESQVRISAIQDGTEYSREDLIHRLDTMNKTISDYFKGIHRVGRVRVSIVYTRSMVRKILGVDHESSLEIVHCMNHHRFYGNDKRSPGTTQ